MRKKVVVTYVTDEGCEIDYSNPTARGFIEVPEASETVDMLRVSIDFLSNNNRALRERIQSLELELQHAHEAYDKLSERTINLEQNYKNLSNELATVNRGFVQAQDKLRKIDDIVSPF